MKRYRILSFDFDSRSHSLDPVQDHWDENVKKQHEERRERTIRSISEQYGNVNLESKVINFKDLKSKPFSVAAFHNKFLEQIRNSFVIGGYYPSLTGACALGERILNHMVILLREYRKHTPEYKNLYRKKSFDYWPSVIDALESWGDLLPEAAKKFRDLNEKRNSAIHFNPETDYKDRNFALEAIHLIQDIVSIQFSAFGIQPWYFCVPGEMYIKKEWENHPLVKHIFVPNAVLVGYKHRIESIIPKVVVNDQFEYEETEISDSEYVELRKSR